MSDELNEIESVVKRVRHGPIKGDLIIELKDENKAKELQRLINELSENEIEDLRDQGD